LFNANDCKYFGLPLRDLLSRFKKIDFVLRSHSSARALPYCIEGYERQFPQLRTREDYLEEFSRFALHVGARYAIPFASNHCYLHPETQRYNSLAVDPAAVAARCNELARMSDAKTECVVMAAGSRWSPEHGFELRPFDYARRSEYIQELWGRYRTKIEETAEEEAQVVGDLGAFRNYFDGFLRAVPRAARRWALEPFGFRVRDREGDRTWMVDPRTGEISVHSSPPPSAIVFETAAKILNDCTSIRMFSVWTASKRLRIHVPHNRQLRGVSALFSLLDAYELDLLPLAHNLCARSLRVHASRWREAAEATHLVFKHGVMRRSFAPRDLYPLPSGATSPAYAT
jgi:UDP-MurNAc hydroxylase